jgi:hypothetical protein
MRTVSGAFLAALRQSHTMQVRARIVTAYTEGVPPNEGFLSIEDGSVTLDATAQIRGTLDLTVDGNGWNPKPGNPITTYGNEIYVERGVEIRPGDVEWVPLGYYRIYDADQDNAPDGPLTITGQDRMSGVIDFQLLNPRQFTATQTVSAVFFDLVHEVYPDATISFDDVDVATAELGRSLICDQDRYSFLNGLARSYGKVMYFDADGRLQIKSAPDPTVPVWDVNAGEDGVLVTASRSLSRQGVYNAVVADGTAADNSTPVRRVAIDSNPSSPTYFFGHYGKVPYFLSSDAIIGIGQAGQAAYAQLQRLLGAPYDVNFQAVPNSALEPLDPIRVTYDTDHGREVHTLQQVVHPLSEATAQTGQTHEQTNQQITIGDDFSDAA